MLLITVGFIHHSLLSEMFYQLLYLVMYIFSIKHVKVTCHSPIADISHGVMFFSTGTFDKFDLHFTAEQHFISWLQQFVLAY